MHGGAVRDPARQGRKDANHAEIVAALRSAGATVFELHKVGDGCPDLAVGFGDVNHLIEIKVPVGKKSPKAAPLTKAQRISFAEWRGRKIAIVTNITEALQVIGAIA